MIGILGRVSAHLVTVSEPSFTSSPDTATVTVWDTIDARGPSWATGGGAAVVPVGGRYLINILAEVNATDAGAAPIGAGFSALFAGIPLGLFTPAFPTDDTNGTAWVAGSAVGIADLTAGDAVAVAIASHDSDAAMQNLGLHRVQLDIVRL